MNNICTESNVGVLLPDFFSERVREVAQLVAHYVRDVGVACSSHVFSTSSDLDEKSKSLFVCPFGIHFVVMVA